MSRRPSHPVRLLASALAAGALLTTAACSDGGGSQSASDTAAEEAGVARPDAAKRTPTGSPSASPATLTEAGAKAALLTEADLEGGWNQVQDAGKWRDRLLVGEVDVADFLTAKSSATDCQALLDALYGDGLLGDPSGPSALTGFEQGDSRLLEQVAGYDRGGLDARMKWLRTLPDTCDEFTATGAGGAKRTVQVTEASVPEVGDARAGLRVSVQGTPTAAPPRSPWTSPRCASTPPPSPSWAGASTAGRRTRSNRRCARAPSASRPSWTAGPPPRSRPPWTDPGRPSPRRAHIRRNPDRVITGRHNGVRRTAHARRSRHVSESDPVPGGRPGEVERATALSGELTGQGVHGVVLAYVDTAGIARVKTVPTAKLAAAAAWGVGMSPVFDTFLADDSIVGTDVLGSPDGDLRLYPDLDRLTMLAAQPGWAWAPVDRITQEGAPHPACGRTVLRRIVAGAAERHGITFRAAVEVEWVVGRGDAGGDAFVPAVSGPAYGAARQVELSDCAADLLAALAAQGVDVEQFHPEYAAGQFEVSVGALGPVAAADHSVLVRQTIRAVSARHGLRVSFAPAVLGQGVGNGGHLHLSAWRDGTNLHAGGTARCGMTAEAESFVAGVLGHLPALTALTAPSPASRLRLRPSQWAGVFTAWGRETREAALRIVTGTAGIRDRAANLEVKPVDLAANPYLALASVIAAGLDGLASSAPLPEEITGDPARLDPAAAAARGVRRLPVTLTESVAAFRTDGVLREALGPVLADAVIAVRLGEAGSVEGLDDDGVAAAYRWKY